MRRVFSGAARARLPTTPCYYSPRLNAYKSSLATPRITPASSASSASQPRPSLIGRDRTAGRVKTVVQSDYESDKVQRIKEANSTSDNVSTGPPLADEGDDQPLRAPLPGDYVFVSCGGSWEDAVFLQLMGRNQAIVLTDSGEHVEVPLATVGVHIPSLFDSELSKDASLPVNEDETIPQARKDAAVQLIRAMRRFKRERDVAAYTVRQVAMGRFYDAFRSPDPDAYNAVQLHQAVTFVRKLLGPKADEFDPNMLKIGTYQYLMEESDYFNSDPYSPTIFHAVPPSTIRRLREVQRWVKTNDPRFEKFVTKAKTIIKDLKASRAASTSSGGEISWSPASEHAFTEDDLTMIQFLNDSLRRGRAQQGNPYDYVLSLLSRAVEAPYKHEGGRDFAFNLLADIGAHPPWGNLLVTDDAATPWTAKDEAIAEAEAKRLAERFKAIQESSSGVPTFGDGVDHIRHDWGDMPAYVIDNESAEELDDGISVVPANDGTNSVWVHVHIADPTALLRPSEPLSKIAQKRTGSLYFMEKTFPLLPAGFASLFSLGRGGPQPVLSISAKISNENGAILETSLKPGILRNVQTVTYDEMDRALGAMTSEGYVLSELSNTPQRSSLKPRVLSHPILEDLKALAKTAETLSRRRGIHGAYNFLYPTRGEVEVAPKPLNSAPFPPPAPMKYQGGPTYYVYKGLSSSFEANNSKWAVAEMMMLGCRVAARHARDNQVPILFRHNHSPNADELCGHLRDPLTGEVPYGPETRMVNTAGGTSTVPGGNSMLGTEGDPYARVTSPLRRFGDLVNHWQLKACMSPNAPRIALEELDAMAADLTTAETVIRKTQRTNRRFWISAAIRRIFNENPGALKGLEAFVGTDPQLMNRDGQKSYWVALHVSALGSEGRSIGMPKKDLEGLDVGSKVLVDVEEVPLAVGSFYNCRIVGRL
ncbi:hypothetical protein M407DRAFT_22419 [Tulasnella calospora MUT 4182]|uniref:RNB domain-containing protein n=1 Tax=Tulasnella calospora MUT 4182 TaxID=1051891 RepID=A0A0C3L3S4_9AGAM|nr:hypothetical protein M407DRAFT_22419 [Tulasnella calospora MUT 4182]